jgi:hypothetical protein
MMLCMGQAGINIRIRMIDAFKRKFQTSVDDSIRRRLRLSSAARCAEQLPCGAFFVHFVSAGASAILGDPDRVLRLSF